VKSLWPELLVLALFLAGDVFCDGMVSAAAGVAAGVVSFLVMLLFRRRKPGLIVEGLIFGGVTALGEILSFPGGNLILMELVAGLILLSSALFRWNIMERMAGGMGKGFVSSAGAKILTITLGGVFFIHSVTFALLSAYGSGGTVFGIVLFVVLYLVALRYSRGRIRRAERASFPRLVSRDGGDAFLEEGGSVLGKMRVTENGGGIVQVSSPVLSVPAPEFLKTLEVCLRSNGFRFVHIEGWQGDELDLEIDGYTEYGGKWKKRI